MSAVLDLLSSGGLNFHKLTTHVFNVENSSAAYDLILGKVQEPYLGVLLEYNPDKIIKNESVQLRNITAGEKISVGFVGLGTFARNYLLPPLSKAGVGLAGVASQNPVNARSAAENLGFGFYCANGQEIINDTRTNTIFIATRHDTHAGFVLDALKAGKPVFVEKPLAVNQAELDNIRTLLDEKGGSLMVGFNRRFSKSFRTIKEFFNGNSDPLFINYRVNAGFIPKSHWVQQSEQGGRIVGEVCHFIDCMVYLTSAKPVNIAASAISSKNSELTDEDNVSITIKFSDGSVGNINYIACGGSGLPKEYCEVHSQRKSAVMNNFENVELYSGDSKKIINTGGKKGIDEEVELFIQSVKNGKEMPISFMEIYSVTKACFAAVESLRNGKVVDLEL